MRNILVNRAVIGQQPVVTTTEAEILNDTAAAEPGRERGTGEIAGDIIINEISQSVIVRSILLLVIVLPQSIHHPFHPIGGQPLMMGVYLKIVHETTTCKLHKFFSHLQVVDVLLLLIEWNRGIRQLLNQLTIWLTNIGLGE